MCGSLTAIRIPGAHDRVQLLNLRVETCAAFTIDIIHDLTEHRVARQIPGRIPGAASRVSLLLTPAILGVGQTVVAGEAIQIGEFGPRVCLRVARDALYLFAQLHCLSHSQHAHVRPGIFIFPMSRHCGCERCQLEVQIRMTGGDHLMVHCFVRRSQVTRQAILGATHGIA